MLIAMATCIVNLVNGALTQVGTALRTINRQPRVRYAHPKKP